MLYALIFLLAVALGIVIFVLIRSRQRLELMRSIYNNHPEPLARLSLDDMSILECNEAFAQILGYATTHDCLLSNQIDHHSLDSLKQRQFSRDKSSPDLGNLHVVALDGSHVLKKVIVTLSSAGEYVDLKFGQADRIQRDQRFIPLPFITLNSSLDVVSINDVAINLFGEGLAVKRNIDRIIRTDLRDRIVGIIHARKRHSHFSIHVPGILNDGRTKTHRWYFHNRASGDLELTCLPLENSTDDWLLLARLLNVQADTWELDYQLGTLDTSKEWARIFGFDEQSSSDRLEFWMQSVHPDDLQPLKEQFRMLYDGQIQEINLSCRMATKEGLEVRILVIGYVCERLADGTPARYKGVQVIEQLAENEEFSELFHDLINQFTSITGFAQLINEVGDPETADYAKQIQIGADRANELLTGVKQHEVVGIYESIDNICDELGVFSVAHNDRGKSVEISTELAELSLRTLVASARESGTPVDDIHVETDFDQYAGEFCSSCGSDLDQPMLRIRLEDGHRVIYRQFMQKILKGGFITDDLVPVGKQGIASLNELVHKAGGHTTLNSSSSGCEISVFLPDSDRQKPDQNTGSKILVIDDEPLVGRYISEVLSAQGYRVTTQTDPVVALERFKKQPAEFDLVITDQKMPGLSGEMIVQEMHKRRLNLPIIICSGYSDGVGESMARNLGASGFSKKPIDIDHLLELVDSQLQIVDEVEN